MLSIAVCDDENTITGQIETLLCSIAKKHGISIEIDVFNNGLSLESQVLDGKKYDLIYLDIEMSSGDGISTAENIRKRDENALLVYVSGYEKYMMELFALDVLAFVKKPIETARFEKVFLNAKCALAREYGISFHLHICVPEELSVAPLDLGVVIGNALDNAITAVKECTYEEKTIQISMGIKKNALVLVIKNPYQHVLSKNRSGELLSTKPEKGKHGYGIRSIRRIAKSYSGDVVIDADHGCFDLTVVLNLNKF